MATDWLVEGVRLFGTGFAVFVGAKLAWNNSSKGRKEDILFKEKYKLYESIDSDLESIKKLLHQLVESASSLLYNVQGDLHILSRNIADKDIENIEELVKSLELAINGLHENKRLRRLFSIKISMDVDVLKDRVKDLIVNTTDITNAYIGYPILKDEMIKQESALVRLKKRDLYGDLDARIDRLRDSIFSDLGLPLKK